MNPRSGGGKVDRFHLVEECQRRGIRPILLQPGNDLGWLAVAAVEQGADLIGMAGGDGSQALVASVAAARGIPYVCVLAGTRNHLALDLGIDRDDVVGALDAFTDGMERRMDLATVNGSVFVNNASMGIYATIVASEDYRDAKAKTDGEAVRMDPPLVFRSLPGALRIRLPARAAARRPAPADRGHPMLVSLLDTAIGRG